MNNPIPRIFELFFCHLPATCCLLARFFTRLSLFFKGVFFHPHRIHAWYIYIYALYTHYIYIHTIYTHYIYIHTIYIYTLYIYIYTHYLSLPIYIFTLYNFIIIHLHLHFSCFFSGFPVGKFVFIPMHHLGHVGIHLRAQLGWFRFNPGLLGHGTAGHHRGQRARTSSWTFEFSQCWKRLATKKTGIHTVDGSNPVITTWDGHKTL